MYSCGIQYFWEFKPFWSVLRNTPGPQAVFFCLIENSPHLQFSRSWIKVYDAKKVPTFQVIECNYYANEDTFWNAQEWKTHKLNINNHRPYVVDCLHLEWSLIVCLLGLLGQCNQLYVRVVCLGDLFKLFYFEWSKTSPTVMHSY